MDNYYVNKNAQPNGDHEVHKENCKYIPKVENRLYLGMHPTCHGAVIKARTIYPKADGCYYCCEPCHNS